MIFKMFDKDKLQDLFDILAADKIIGPVSRGKGKDGKPLYDFGQIRDFKDLKLDFTTTVHSLKHFVLPLKQSLCSFDMKEDDWEKHVDFNVDKPVIFFGLHTCDISALNKLDKVLLHSGYPDPYYASTRKNMFIIGISCLPEPSCFCRSMKADSVIHGFDLFLTDLGDKYFVEVLSAMAYDYLKNIETEDPAEKDHRRFIKAGTEKKNQFTTHVDTTDLSKILDMEFQSEAWEAWGKLCLSCGTCASVCPTCYCYDVEQDVDPDLKSARKVKRLYSCNLVDFAEVAGGHNFRPESHIRLKYRFYHKQRGFLEAFEEPLCVGCGRCGEACLSDITVPKVIASIRKGE